MDVGNLGPAALGFKNWGMAADCAQTMAAKRPWFTLAAEKYVFPGGAGENMDWILFSRLRTGKLCEAFAPAAQGA